MSPVDGRIATSALAGPDVREQPLGSQLQVACRGSAERLPGDRLLPEQLALLAVARHRVHHDAGRAAQLLVVPRLEAGQPGDGRRPGSGRGPPRSSRRSPRRPCRGSAPRTPGSARAGACPRPRARPGCRRSRARTPAAPPRMRYTIASTNALSPAASTCFTYGATSMSASVASCRADSPAPGRRHLRPVDAEPRDRPFGDQRLPAGTEDGASLGRDRVGVEHLVLRQRGLDEGGAQTTCQVSSTFRIGRLGRVGPLLLAERPGPGEGGGRALAGLTGLGDLTDLDRRGDLAHPLDELRVLRAHGVGRTSVNSTR